MSHTLVVLAAGSSTRYGGWKQLEAVGPHGATLLDYAIYDAVRAGFSRVVLVVRSEVEPAARAHIEQQFQERVPVTYACQRLDTPPGRAKPWGTAHAVLAAEHELDAPFAVCNADDFYGASAYQLLSRHLDSQDDSQSSVFALVAYTLRDTLSPFGGVSRAICECDRRGFLETIVEVKDIQEKGGRIRGVSVDGEEYLLNGGETISRNIWGFTPALFPALHRQWAEFRRGYGADAEAEFLLSTAVNDQIAAGEARVQVCPAPDQSFGITFPQDHPQVAQRIAELVAKGHYPGRLLTGIR